MKHMVAEATGGNTPLIKSHIVEEKLYMVWEALVPIIHKESDTVQIQAKTTEDIISAVCEGKITFRETEKLMALLREQQDIELLPELINKFLWIDPKY